MQAAHEKCFAHTLQLVVKDGLQNADKQVTKFIAKASKIASHVRKSTKATMILEGERKIQNLNSTRWNTQLSLIESILSITESKLNELDTYHLSKYERSYLEDVYLLLKPLNTATDMIQKELTVTASLVIPCIRGLKLKYENLSTKYNTKLLNNIKKAIDDRLSVYESNHFFIIATMLDPRFKVKWCDGAEEVSAATNLLQTTLQNIMPEQNSSPPRKRQKRENHEDDLLSYMQCTDYNRTPQDYINAYLNSACENRSADPLAYWKTEQHNYEKLAHLAQKYLSIQASSASVERIFSIAGKIFKPDRCSLSDEIFESLMMLRCNKL